MAGRTTISKTWLQQAEADLRAAEDSAASGHHEWSCFQAQQAGEKALKSFLYARGRTGVITHSLRRLLSECGTLDATFSDLDEEARLLDQYYIPTRYPNGLDEEIAPVAYYDAKDSERCLRCARSILARVKPFFAS